MLRMAGGFVFAGRSLWRSRRNSPIGALKFFTIFLPDKSLKIPITELTLILGFEIFGNS